ncbi:hypothetical protein MUB24_10525 [Lederbergia sp. NSJ-179]|uniref:hypothetical protein n=1 Tax=Lederbergia sp. NSJ-179 TaxID=2931402 RepID=UPI001FD39A9D|nr:hypothetical protein [Lederbergia sp. NSJ-179]MCJ7841328.1 hypothetical protein [Lederbergia sp. NSJ-179]
MLPVPKDGGTFWTQYKDLRIQILYGIYDSYISVSASYYLWGEESVDGFCKHPNFRMALKGSIKSLLNEMAELGIDIWVTSRPSTNQKAKIVLFQPEKDVE